MSMFQAGRKGRKKVGRAQAPMPAGTPPVKDLSCKSHSHPLRQFLLSSQAPLPARNVPHNGHVAILNKISYLYVCICIVCMYIRMYLLSRNRESRGWVVY